MNKKISTLIATTLLAFSFIFTSLPVDVYAATKWYTTDQIGVSVYNPSLFDIKVSGNTVKYRSLIDSETGAYTKWKTAKLTSKTKYYRGDKKRFFDQGRADYLKKSNKKTFKSFYNKVKNEAYGVTAKGGKVTIMIFNAQVAG